MVTAILSISADSEIITLIKETYGKGNISPACIKAILADINKNKAVTEGKVPEMIRFIEDAIILKKTRPEAESDYGRVFPDEVWAMCGGK